MQATTPIKASRIILSMVATKGIEKERHCTASVVWRSMTTWNEKHETDKCWGEVRNILMGELVIGVPMTFVSENHGYVLVHRGIFLRVAVLQRRSNAFGRHISTQRSCHESNRCGSVDDGKTQLVQRNEMEPTGIRMEVKQQTC